AVGRLGVGDVDLGRQPDQVQRGGANCRADDGDVVVPVGAVDDHGVGLPVAVVEGVRPEGDVDHAHAGAGQAVDRDGVGPAQGDDVDPLQAIQVHRHPVDVAGDPRPRAVRREGDVVVDVAAEESQQVVAGAAVDCVVPVARVPGEPVVAGAPNERVVPRTPV